MKSVWSCVGERVFWWTCCIVGLSERIRLIDVAQWSLVWDGFHVCWVAVKGDLAFTLCPVLRMLSSELPPAKNYPSWNTVQGVYLIRDYPNYFVIFISSFDLFGGAGDLVCLLLFNAFWRPKKLCKKVLVRTRSCCHYTLGCTSCSISLSPLYASCGINLHVRILGDLQGNFFPLRRTHV